MKSKAMFEKKSLKTVTSSSGLQSTHQPYIVRPALPASRASLERRPPASPRQSVINSRGHRGLKLVSAPQAAPTARRFWTEWLNQKHLAQKHLPQKHLPQKHLDRGFLFLAACSALLLLISSR
jgi:hypothetical protein